MGFKEFIRPSWVKFVLFLLLYLLIEQSINFAYGCSFGADDYFVCQFSYKIILIAVPVFAVQDFFSDGFLSNYFVSYFFNVFLGLYIYFFACCLIGLFKNIFLPKKEEKMSLKRN